MSGWSKACGADARRVAAEVLEPYGLTLEDVRAPNYKRRLARPRQHVMHALAATGKYSRRAIGRFLDRDHTTVLFGIRQHEKRRAEL